MSIVSWLRRALRQTQPPEMALSAGVAHSPIGSTLVYLSDIGALSSEDRSRLAEKHALPAPVLDHCLELLVLRQIPPERLDEALRPLQALLMAFEIHVVRLPLDDVGDPRSRAGRNAHGRRTNGARLDGQDSCHCSPHDAARSGRQVATQQP